MAYYTQRRQSKMVYNPQTKSYEKQYYYTQVPVSSGASMFGELKNIQKSAETGQMLTVPGEKRNGASTVKTYGPTQQQTLIDISEAKKAGADPRQFRTKSYFGFGPDMKVGAEQAALEGPIAVQRGYVNVDLEGLANFAAAEKNIQPKLQKIKEARAQKVIEESKLLRRQTGRRALLASPTGGRGFFGGYFKG